MTTDSSWLPDLVHISDYEHDWCKYLDALHQHFCDDFVRSQPELQGKPCGLAKPDKENGKHGTFWHIITEENPPVRLTSDMVRYEDIYTEPCSEPNRVINPRRCTRIRWPRPIVEAVENGEVFFWRATNRGRTKVKIALKDFSYLVVLAERPDHHLLITAYYVERRHSRDQLKSEYQHAVYEEKHKKMRAPQSDTRTPSTRGG